MIETITEHYWPIVSLAWHDLFAQLSQRLSPVVEGLRPIWSDPLWQFIALIVVFLLMFVFLYWLVRKGQKTLLSLLRFIKGVFLTPLIWLKKNLAQLISKRAKNDHDESQSWSWKNRIMIRRGIDAIRYLTTRRDWRYKSAWYVFTGSEASKKNWLASIKRGRRVQLSLKEKQLPAAGSGWHFFDRGLIVDIESEHFSETVGLLTQYRPERPLDGVILTLSARELLALYQGSDEGDDHSPLEQCRKLGESLYRQLWELQKQTGFVVPVYIMVTQCEAVNGFEPFWLSQPKNQLGQMFGWSNPSRLDVGFSKHWVNDAFSQMLNDIKAEQLHIAAVGQGKINDEFVLFDQQFRQLEQPLADVMEYVFSHSSFYDAPPLRGIYFSGKVGEEIALNEDFLAHKVWPETHLSYPIEQRHFSINRTLRRFQYASLVFAALLLFTLIIDSTRLYQYSNETERSWKHIANENIDKDYCSESGAQMWWLLNGLTTMSEQPLTLSLPISWNNGQLPDLQQAAASYIYPSIVFHALECRLKIKAENLRSLAGTDISRVRDLDKLKEKLEQFTDELINYQTAQNSFVRLAGPLASDKGVATDFKALLNYLYDSEIPFSIDFHDPLIAGTVVIAVFNIVWEEDELVNPEMQLERLNELSRSLRKQIENFALQPPLAEIQQAFFTSTSETGFVTNDREHMQQALDSFQDWSEYIEQYWLSARIGHSPCSQVYQELQSLQFVLSNSGYHAGSLNNAVNYFSPQQCDRKIFKRLDLLNIAPLGKLFIRSAAGSLQFTPQLLTWQQEFSALASLNIMAREYDLASDAKRAVAIVGNVIAWRSEPLDEAVEVLLAFQAYRQQWWQHNNGRKTEPFYAPAVRQRMMLVLEELIEQAQHKELTIKPTPLTQKRDSEALLGQTINSFTHSEGLLRQLAVLLQQEGDISNAVVLQKSTTNFVRQQLQKLTKVALKNRLYQPLRSPYWGSENFASALFSYQTSDKMDDYLVNQRQRASYLAQHYARPLVNYLLDSNELGQADSSSRYWYNTLMDLRRFERQQPENGIAKIERFIAKDLSTLSSKNCLDWMNTPSDTRGAGLFADHHQRINNQVRRYCESYSKNSVISQYLALAEYFNQQLAGHFPFASIDQAGSNDIDVAQINNFVRIYQKRWGEGKISDQKQDKKSARQGLLQELQRLVQQRPELALDNWLQFVSQIDQFVRFWQQGLNKKGKFIMPLEVEFAALPEQSLGMRQIIEWQLASASQTLFYPNGDKQFSWQPGDQLNLTLRWARGSDYSPVRNLSTPVQIDTSKKSALFSSHGRWGLFEWSQRFSGLVLNSAQQHQTDRTRTLLAFNVPVMAQISASTEALDQPAYISRVNLWLNGSGSSDKGNAKRLAIPARLPQYAPGLSFNNEFLSDESLTTELNYSNKEDPLALTYP